MPVCPPCRAAGADNKDANERTDPAMHDALQGSAKALHAQCPGGNHCVCHHYVGQAIATNTDRFKNGIR